MVIYLFKVNPNTLISWFKCVWRVGTEVNRKLNLLELD